MPDVSVIICTYNRGESLSATLDSLAQLKLPSGLSWELILVDNNSTDNTKKIVEVFASNSLVPLRYFHESKQGLSHARNRGIQEAAGKIIVFTDDDVTVAEDWLSQLLDVFHQRGCMAAGGKIIPVWTTPQPRWFTDQGPYSLAGAVISCQWGEEIREAPHPPFGANMAFKSEVFQKYGVFRTDLGRGKGDMMGGEETEFFRRLINDGEKVLYTPHAVVFHPVEAKRTQKSYFKGWYYDSGRSRARLQGLPAEAKFYFGAPRYLFRQIAENALKWWSAIDPKRRFYHKLQVYYLAGMTSEMRLLRTNPAALQPTKS
jgi:glycosyltransferase involved in cell wall biosynthesis